MTEIGELKSVSNGRLVSALHDAKSVLATAAADRITYLETQLKAADEHAKRLESLVDIKTIWDDDND